jgi:CBS domain-containing protein
MDTCSDVMTRNPVCALPKDTVVMVAQIMKERDIGPVPVVKDTTSRKLIGIVTDRDLALKVVATGHNPNEILVEDVMTKDVVTCHEDDDVQTALDAMASHQLRRIPVVDADNSLVGIIAQADVATRMDEPEKTGEVVKEISQ